MSLKHLPHRTALIIAILVLGLVLGLVSACNPQAGTPTPAASPTGSTVEKTATPNVPPELPEIWLVAGPEVDPAIRQQYADWLGGQAEETGMVFSSYENFQSSNVPAQLKTVVFLSDFPDLPGLAANMPETQFVLVTETDVQPSANVSVILGAKSQAVFLAGYLAILNAPDFRAGALLIDDGSRNLQQQAFLNGGRYFCGRCSPVYAPIVTFPQVVLVPAGSEAAGWQSAFDTLNQNRIEILYLPAEAIQPVFLDYLATQNVGIISNAAPPADYEGLWVATVANDSFSSFTNLWQQVITGAGGQKAQANLSLINVNPDRLSIGRQQLAERIIPDLTSGKIEPLDLP